MDLTISLPAKHLEELKTLTSRCYGKDSKEVAEYLIARALDDLRRMHVLPLQPHT